jgi:hypothetical protein
MNKYLINQEIEIEAERLITKDDTIIFQNSYEQKIDYGYGYIWMSDKPEYKTEWENIAIFPSSSTTVIKIKE